MTESSHLTGIPVQLAVASTVSEADESHLDWFPHQLHLTIVNLAATVCGCTEPSWFRRYHLLRQITGYAVRIGWLVSVRWIAKTFFIARPFVSETHCPAKISGLTNFPAFNKVVPSFLKIQKTTTTIYIWCILQCHNYSFEYFFLTTFCTYRSKLIYKNVFHNVRLYAN